MKKSSGSILFPTLASHAKVTQVILMPGMFSSQLRAVPVRARMMWEDLTFEMSSNARGKFMLMIT